jgi:hypothetical protein
MKLSAFLSVPVIVLAIAPTQLGATIQPNSLTSTAAQTSTTEPITSNSTLRDTATVKPTLLLAQHSRSERIRFAAGANAATIQTEVIRGTRDTFLVAATKGQRMSVSITSVEKNAVFDIKAPNGRLLKQEATSWSSTLSLTGDYRVIVGGTRGNASYRLKVSVK